MSSLADAGWTRKLRNGKVFTQVHVPTVDFALLVLPAVERSVISEKGVSSRRKKDAMAFVEEDGVRYAPDFMNYTNSDSVSYSSPSKGKLEDLPAATDSKKRKHMLEDRSENTQSLANVRRAKKRRKIFEGHPTRVRSNPRPYSDPIDTQLAAKTLPSKSDGYTAMNVAHKSEFQDSTKLYNVEELRRIGFRVIAWDGISSIPILDAEDRIIAVLAGRPKDQSYLSAANEFHLDILKCRAKISGNAETQSRGPFPAQAIGLSYGLGQPFPERLRNVQYGDMMEELLRTRNVERIAGFQSSSYYRWSPKNYDCYSNSKIFLQTHEKTKNERWNFDRSVFAAATVNFGPQTRTYKHRDVQNALFGWCAVTALGDFNPRLGGHLVMWDLDLVVEFPAGSTVLLPSATVAHSNTPVLPGETRTSFTQYSAGPIFRWVESGGRSLDELRTEDPDAYRANRASLKMKTAVLKGVARFSTLQELIDHGLIY